MSSIILDIVTWPGVPLEDALVLKLDPFIPGDPVEDYLLSPGDGCFLVGEVPVMLFLWELEVIVEDFPSLDGDEPPFKSLAFVS